MAKPDCYKCEYRGDLPGDAHSCCKHPKNADLLNDPLAQLLGLFASVHRIEPVGVETGLNVKGNPHGINRGRFNWPINFDPVWLEECDGFTLKSGLKG
jgi:hypothetical protein